MSSLEKTIMWILTVVFAASAVLFLVLWLRSVEKLRKYSVNPPLIVKHHADSSFRAEVRPPAPVEFMCFPYIEFDTKLPLEEKENVQVIVNGTNPNTVLTRRRL